MKYITRLILIFGILSSLYNVYGQNNFNDLYYENYKGKVKSSSITTFHYDSTYWKFGVIEKTVTIYDEEGFAINEWDYFDSLQIKSKEMFYKTVEGRKNRTKKIQTESRDSSIKTTHFYYFDQEGFDTAIVVLRSDSSYHMQYAYEKNKSGLRTKGIETNAKNGHKNYTFEIYYSNDLLIDSVIYYDSFDRRTYAEQFSYNSFREVDITKYSDGGMTLFVYKKRDGHGNWLEREVYFEESSKRKLVTRQIRVIEYY